MQIYSEMHNIVHKTLDAFSPGPYRCLICQNEDLIGEDGLCDACRQDLRYCPAPNYLSPLEGLNIGLQYTDAVRKAVLSLKKGRSFVYAPFLAQFMTVPNNWQADLLVPVPIHPVSELLRGFNQSALLAEYLSSKYSIPYSTEILLKKRFTMPQKGLGADSRRRNIRNSFYAEPECKNLRIVLIDDVFTTGATVYECAKTLKKAGASRVYACCAASPAL